MDARAHPRITARHDENAYQTATPQRRSSRSTRSPDAKRVASDADGTTPAFRLQLIRLDTGTLVDGDGLGHCASQWRVGAAHLLDLAQERE